MTGRYRHDGDMDESLQGMLCSALAVEMALSVLWATLMNRQLTSKGQKLLKYRARFVGRADLQPVAPVDIEAVNEFQARAIARGIANKNNWAVTSVGRI